jgi:uncharacterized protein (TIGR00369 family)
VTATFEELLEYGLGPQFAAAHLGVEVVRCGDGKALMRLAVRPELMQNAGVLQGGITATLMDITMAWATLSVIHPRHAPTVDLTVSYLRPIVEETIECEAVVVRAGRSMAHVRAEVTTEAGLLAATGSGNFLITDPLPRPGLA